MVIDTLTIVLSIAIIVLGIISAMMNPLFRIPLKKMMHEQLDEDIPADEESFTEETAENTSEESAETGNTVTPALPPLSVIVSVNDNIDTLERNLPLLLEQDYEPGFQIILVANEGDSAADDLIKRYQDEATIQSTFIPKTSRYVSKEKLGVTLGVKAAKHEWCVLLDALCYPESRQWLKEMGKACTEEHNLVIGYCNYDTDSKSFQRFWRMRHFAYIWREALHGIPFASNNSNLAFRKSEFIKKDGYRGNLEVVRGEYDFLVNKYARKGKTGIVTSQEGMLTEIAPYHKQWHRHQVFYLHSAKMMEHGGGHNMLTALDSLLMHLFWLLSIATITFAAITQNWILLSAPILALIINIIWRIVQGKRAVEYFNIDISSWNIIPLELTSVWHTLGDKCRYGFASQYDFTCHKL